MKYALSLYARNFRSFWTDYWLFNTPPIFDNDYRGGYISWAGAVVDLVSLVFRVLTFPILPLLKTIIDLFRQNEFKPPQQNELTPQVSQMQGESFDTVEVSIRRNVSLKLDKSSNFKKLSPKHVKTKVLTPLISSKAQKREKDKLHNQDMCNNPQESSKPARLS